MHFILLLHVDALSEGLGSMFGRVDAGVLYIGVELLVNVYRTLRSASIFKKYSACQIAESSCSC